MLTLPCCNGLFQQEDEKKRKDEERKQTIAQKNEAERKRKEREVIKMSHNNWRAQSKNDPLIFRPFLKVFRSS